MRMWLEDTIQAVLAPVGVLGNLIIVVAFLRDVKLMKSEGAFALLALCDMFYGFISGWWEAEKLMSASGELVHWRCLLRSARGVATTLSHCTICCIAVDRILRLRRPCDKTLRCWPHQRRVLQRTIGALFVVGTLQCAALGVGFALAHRGGNTSATAMIHHSDCLSNTVVTPAFLQAFVLSALALGVAMVVLNALVYFYVRKLKSKLRGVRMVLAMANCPGAAEEKKRAERESASGRLLMAVMGLFLISWLCPGVFLMIYRYPLASYDIRLSAAEAVAAFIMRTADSVNAASNIVVYSLKHQEIRKGVLNLFRK